MLTVESLIGEFCGHLSLADPPAEKRLLNAAANFLAALGGAEPVSYDERRVRLLALVNRKFELNKSCLDRLFTRSAKKGVTFNYHEKVRVSAALNRNDQELFEAVLLGRGIDQQTAGAFFQPVSCEETLKRLHKELKSPTLVRKDSKARNWSPEILQSIFGGFVFSAYPTELAHAYFDEGTTKLYEPDYWQYLHSRRGGFSRTKSLTYIHLTPGQSLEKACCAVRAEYESLANHGHLAIHLSGWKKDAWRAAGLITLYAEKFEEKRLSGAFFRWKEIQEQTEANVPLKCGADYKFQCANIGFHYKDTFVFVEREVTDILLIFQKNVADEALVACPACRSHEVQGNSYSSLGVKSWECRNLLCPDRSKFNRGKRYSFYQLLKQQAIEVEENRIPVDSVRSWARDVQGSERANDLLPMLIQHYSLAGDGVLVVGGAQTADYGRAVTYRDCAEYLVEVPMGSELSRCLSLAYFNRFCIKVDPEPAPPLCKAELNGVSALLGNSSQILGLMGESSLDGAITSPPYYNAREYSQWANIYCYLYDMYTSARMVFRALKPGGYYLFNIFDYFDNERNITFSAMGQKRMILSAYCIDIFERAGFRCEGNVVWDKGEIEGKRAFNGGNFSPYYQAPFNCWEHVLVFRKPGDEVRLTAPLPDILRSKPVVKIVGGENRHGHTAPFPEAVPRLLLDRLPPTAVVLDPFAGSMTTGVAACRTGRRAICIELNDKYFELGRSMLGAESAQSALL